jgi:hypothetical protein
MTATVKHGFTWDAVTGNYARVTDVLDPVHGASRISGHIPEQAAVAIVLAARKRMEKTT